MLVCAEQLDDGCLFVHGWVLINSLGRVLIHAWTGAYVCMDGYLCMNGRVLNMYERVLLHPWTGVLYAWMGAWTYYNE